MDRRRNQKGGIDDIAARFRFAMEVTVMLLFVEVIVFCGVRFVAGLWFTANHNVAAEESFNRSEDRAFAFLDGGVRK